MRILVTGAGGFVGTAVVDAARRDGHDVVAMRRPGAAPPERAGSSASSVAWDLRAGPPPDEALAGVDAVVHCAAALGGDLATQMASTVVGTEHLLTALAGTGTRLVAVSSFSVYDLRAVPEGGVVDEATPLDRDGPHRDAYARAKLVQERLTTEAHAGGDVAVVTVRPGIVYGPGRLRHALLGRSVLGRFVRFAPSARAPITWVDNTAAALVAAAVRPGVEGETLNVVDDDVPTNATYADEVARRTGEAPGPAVPWRLVAATAEAADVVDRWVFRRSLLLPGLLVPARVHASFRPLRFSNAQARRVLDWRPVPVGAALDACVAAEALGHTEPSPPLAAAGAGRSDPAPTGTVGPASSVPSSP